MNNSDFSILASLLANDEHYLGAGGANAIEDRNGLNVVANMAYSVYLYLKKIDMLTPDNMKEYFREMNKYVYYTRVYDYHLVNAAKLKIETGYGVPLEYCCVLHKKNEEFKKDVFDALMAFVHCPDTLNNMINFFEDRTDEII